MESFNGTETCVLSTFDASSNQTFVNRLFIVEPVSVNTVGLSCFNSCDPCVIQQVDITFQVDMTNEVVSADGIHLVGSFNSFNPTATPMLDANNDGVYDVTISLNENTDYEYRFVNGASFSGFENVSGQPCEENFGNRGITTASSNQTLPAVCFGLCVPCSGTIVSGCTDASALNYDASATIDDGSCIYPVSGCTDATASNYDSAATTDDGSCLFPVTFTVDMNCSGVSFNTVFITGPFTGWCGNCFPLTDANNDGIWEGTYDFPAGDLEYKYEVDDWAHQEDLVDDMVNGGTCAPVTDYFGYANRLVTVGGVTVTDDNYGSCDDCVGSLPGCLDPLADNYDPNATVDDGSCTYTGVLGCTDATASNFNSAATSDDGSCLFPVTFTVDMNCYPDAFSTVYVTGPVFGWCADCFPLSDADGDGVWEGTGDFPAGDLEYKYQLDQWAHQEDLVDDMVNGGTCAPVTDYFGYANRLVTIAGVTVTDDNYGSCDDCISNPINGCTDPAADNYDPNANVDDGSCTYAGVLGCTDPTASNYNSAATNDDFSCLFPVTFTVDMNCYPDAFGTVYVTGPSLGWCADCFPLSDADGDGVWEGTGDFPPGDFEYKYQLDQWAHQEDLIDDMTNGASCAPVTDYWSFANRIVTISGVTVTDDNYGSCDDCITSVEVFGCTDPSADNYNSAATDDDGSCVYCSTFDLIVISQSNVTSTGTCDGTAIVAGVGGTSPYNISWPANPFALCEGTYTVSATDAEGCFTSVDIQINGPSVAGCTDANASNYDSAATSDDGSCVYPVTFTVDMNCYPDAFGTVYVTGPSLGWCADCFPLSDADGDGVWEGTGDFPAGDLEYKYQLDQWAHQEDLVDDMVNGGTCAPVTDYFGYANRLVTIAGVTVTDDNYGSCEDCVPAVLGCTDVNADNYDASATQDDGSCTYTAVCNAPTGLNTYDVVHTRATFNFTSTGADYYKIRVKENGGAWQVITQLGTATGTPGGSTKTKYFLTADASYEWQVRAWCIDGQVSGWSTSAFFNTLPECPNATNQYASDIEAEWAVLNWDAPTNTVAGVNYYLARIQEDGASSWNIVTPANGGTDNFKLKGQLIPGATYNFETRTWCNTGDANNPTDPYYKSDWGGSASFTTVPCPVQTFNLYTSNVNATTQFFGADFVADGNVPYDHFTLRFREVGATAWQFRSITAAHIAAGGRNVGGLTTGVEYEWGIRTFCGAGSTWKSPWESGPNFVAGGSSARLVAPVTALEVYPNPSRDIFNVSFTSEEAQTINVKVVNVIGEVVYTENLEEFTGQYTNIVDMNTQPKGVYFLEITTNTGGVNKKIVLQ